MRKVRLKKVRLKSMMKLGVINGFVLGALMGIISFFIGLFGGDVTASFGDKSIHGLTAAVICLFAMPITMAATLALYGFLMNWALTFGLNVLKGVDVEFEGEFEGEMLKETEFSIRD